MNLKIWVVILIEKILYLHFKYFNHKNLKFLWSIKTLINFLHYH